MTGVPAPKPDAAGVEGWSSRGTRPSKTVVRVVTAQLLDEDVDVVVARRGRAPREVDAAAQLDVRARRRGTSPRARRCRRRARRSHTAPAGRSSRPAVPRRRTDGRSPSGRRPRAGRVAGRLLRRLRHRRALAPRTCRGCPRRSIALPSGSWRGGPAVNFPSIETGSPGRSPRAGRSRPARPRARRAGPAARSRSCARRASSPPPLPNTAAISAATAITSLRFHGRPLIPASVRKSLMPCEVVVDVVDDPLTARVRASTRSTCVREKVLGLLRGAKGWKLCASWKGFSPGTSSAADPAGAAEACPSEDLRSSAVTKPIAVHHVVAGRRLDVRDGEAVTRHDQIRAGPGRSARAARSGRRARTRSS